MSMFQTEHQQKAQNQMINGFHKQRLNQIQIAASNGDPYSQFTLAFADASKNIDQAHQEQVKEAKEQQQHYLKTLQSDFVESFNNEMSKKPTYG